jgi:hypothetical protein
MATLRESSSTTLRWLSVIKSKIQEAGLSLGYRESKYWASLKSPKTGRNIAYLHPQKTQIRLLTTLDLSFDAALQATPASNKWACMYPSVFKIRSESSVDKAVDLIISSYREDSRGVLGTASE